MWVAGPNLPMVGHRAKRVKCWVEIEESWEGGLPSHKKIDPSIGGAIRDVKIGFLKVRIHICSPLSNELPNAILSYVH